MVSYLSHKTGAGGIIDVKNLELNPASLASIYMGGHIIYSKPTRPRKSNGGGWEGGSVGLTCVADSEPRNTQM